MVRDEKVCTGPTYYNPDALIKQISRECLSSSSNRFLSTYIYGDSDFASNLALTSSHWINMKVEGMGGFEIPCSGYVKVNLRIPQIAKFNDDI